MRWETRIRAAEGPAIVAFWLGTYSEEAEIPISLEFVFDLRYWSPKLVDS